MFSIGPFTFHLYGLLVGTAIVVVFHLVEKIVERENLKIDFISLFLTTLVFAFIGARGYHLLTDASLYQNASWIERLSVWNGGMSIIGAVMGGVFGVWLSLKLQKKETEILKLLDAIAVAIPLGQAIGRWGNYFNQELYGLPTNLPWGIYIDEAHRVTQYQNISHFHPLFLYESILCIILFAFLQKMRQKFVIGTGFFLGSYLIGYGLIRFSLEFIRIETARTTGLLSLFSIAQWWMLVAMGIGGWLVFRSYKKYAQKTK